MREGDILKIIGLNNAIYCIEINKKKYIGSTTRWPIRDKQHFSALKNNKHRNKYLQRVFNKHKEYKITVLEFCESENVLLEMERF